MKNNCEQIIDPKQKAILKHIGEAADTVNETCYLVGGLVRDCLMGKGGKDLDIVCSNPDPIITKLIQQHPEVKEVHKGENSRFKSHIIMFGDEKIDVVEPRRESYTKDSIKPDVDGGTFIDDAYRRDFTLNAIYLGLGKDDWMQVIDLTGKGVNDLSNKVLNTPKDPDITFQDDPTRILRGIRFAACKKMHFDPRVRESIENNRNQIQRIPAELIRDELIKGGQCDHYYEIMDSLGILEEIIPEVTALRGLYQNPKGHTTDALTHTFRYVEQLPNDGKKRLVGLLHDIGKAQTADTEGHTYGHDDVGAEEANEILTRLKFSKTDTDAITRLVASHMKLHLYNQDRPDEKSRRKFQTKYGDIVPELIEMSKADILSDNPNPDKALKELDAVIKKIERTKMEMGESSKKQFKLAISGNDLMTMGFEGQEIGKMKKLAEKMVVEEGFPNDKDKLLAYIGNLK